ALEDTTRLLSDCDAVLASMFGPSVKRSLEISGITVFEISILIDDALEKLRHYYFKKRGSLSYEQGN
ncbi:MAG: hypothetical protein ACRDBM_04120, partial [Sporomusa sp.]